MHWYKKYTRPDLFLFIGVLSFLILQSIWIFRTYKMEYRHLMTESKDAFNLAYQKEQTYRIPVVDIINPGGVTIQGCGNEEIHIIRKCLSDTIVYNNISGHSIESFIHHVFWDLREQIVPLNIYCLADLFAGMLHDMNLRVPFVIERYNIHTGEILDASLLPDEKQPEMKPENTIVSEISDKEAIRAVLHITPGMVLGKMTGSWVPTIFLGFMVLTSLVVLYRNGQKNKKTNIVTTMKSPEQTQNNIFRIGQYSFNPGKNELKGFDEIIQLNKKENAILYSLCQQQGNVVERNILLEENWGSSGIIYSRSLDTYLTTLRKYLKKDPLVQIITVKGVGYKLIYPE